MPPLGPRPTLGLCTEHLPVLNLTKEPRDQAEGASVLADTQESSRSTGERTSLSPSLAPSSRDPRASRGNLHGPRMPPEPPTHCLDTGVPLQMFGHSSWDSCSPSAPRAWIGFKWLITFQILNLSTRSPDWIPWVLGRLWSVRRSGLGWAGAPGTVDPRTCQAQDPPPSHLWLSPS